LSLCSTIFGPLTESDRPAVPGKPLFMRPLIFEEVGS